MIDKNYKYKGLDFSDDYQYTLYQSQGYSYLLQDVEKNTIATTNITNRANYHGGYSSETLIGPRIMTFKGVIVGSTKEKRSLGRKMLVDNIKPESNPNIRNRGFYYLTFTDDGGVEKSIYCKVLTPPTATNGLGEPTIEYTFDLLSESEKVYGSETSVTGQRGGLGGGTLPNKLPNKLGKALGFITLVNNGNRSAPCKITLSGTMLNPKIYNLTNGQKYRLGGITQNLVLDNRNINNNPLETFIVTDNGINVKNKRTSGADILLEPGVNKILVIADNAYKSITSVDGITITDINGNPIGYVGESTEQITITYRNTYIY